MKGGEDNFAANFRHRRANAIFHKWLCLFVTEYANLSPLLSNPFSFLYEEYLLKNG